MSTHCTVKFYENNKPLLAVYHQYDGYFKGVGLDMANFLLPFQVVDGIAYKETSNRVANGISCLAAQYIASFKTKVGGVYITHLDDSQEYDYELSLDSNSQLIICAYENGEEKYKGSISEFIRYIQS